MAGAITGVLELSYFGSAQVTSQRFVKLTGDQSVARQDTAGGFSLGVAGTDVQNPNPESGRNEITDQKDVAVQVLGVAWIEAGAAVNRGDKVTSDNQGRAVATAAGNSISGVCLKGGSGAGKLILVLLTPHAGVVA